MKLFIGLMAAATILVPASPILCQTASAPALDPFTIDDLLILAARWTVFAGASGQRASRPANRLRR